MRFVFQDPTAAFWDLLITPDGILQTGPSIGGPALPWLLQATDGNAIWQLGIDASGRLQTTFTSNVSGFTVYQKLFLTAWNRESWYLTVLSSGALQTTFFPSPFQGCSYNLQDANGQLWKLTVTIDGILQTTAIASGVAAVLVLQSTGGFNWALGVDTSGRLTTGRSPITGNRNVTLSSPGLSSVGWYLRVGDSGLIYTQKNLAFEAPPLIGTQYRSDTLFSQPEGPGTLVYPQQSVGEMNGTFACGCGHFFNDWMVYEQAVCGITSAILCCPMCTYIQQIITPQALIYTDAFAILVG